jgi:hypothetical protein
VSDAVGFGVLRDSLSSKFFEKKLLSSLSMELERGFESSRAGWLLSRIVETGERVFLLVVYCSAREFRSKAASSTVGGVFPVVSSLANKLFRSTSYLTKEKIFIKY